MMDGLNRILKERQNPIPSERGKEQVKYVLLSFYAYFIHKNICVLRYHETKKECDEEVTREEFEKYYLRAQERIPYHLFCELEKFFFRLTGKEVSETTIVQYLKTLSPQEVKMDFDESYRGSDDLIEEMYRSHTEKDSKNERVSYANIGELIERLSSF